MKTAKELRDFLNKSIENRCTPSRIDDLKLTMRSESPLCFMLTQADRIPYNVAPNDNIAISFTETERGFSTEFFLRSDPLHTYSRSLPDVADCCMWRWDEDVEEFIEPFLRVAGYTNLHEIMRTIGIFHEEEQK